MRILYYGCVGMENITGATRLKIEDEIDSVVL